MEIQKSIEEEYADGSIECKMIFSEKGEKIKEMYIEFEATLADGGLPGEGESGRLYVYYDEWCKGGLKLILMDLVKRGYRYRYEIKFDNSIKADGVVMYIIRGNNKTKINGCKIKCICEYKTE
ncbi:MAG: hypothetical protein QW052_06255 [Candidatus Nitrosocaldaceae archaeon]